ncbi:hypothetical protein PoMZ_11322 [Pyricularia oryzae]|uniref:Uncharacterized protein n=1 Tax=Pyricularia oryzae TaxID=318829 RepID=A0A4P7NK23_PYROR|nr:hypothetical protein PoMZ_11322 [Pyricularia oryzae]
MHDRHSSLRCMHTVVTQTFRQLAAKKIANPQSSRHPEKKKSKVSYRD